MTGRQRWSSTIAGLGHDAAVGVPDCGAILTLLARAATPSRVWCKSARSSACRLSAPRAPRLRQRRAVRRGLADTEEQVGQDDKHAAQADQRERRFGLGLWGA